MKKLHKGDCDLSDEESNEIAAGDGFCRWLSYHEKPFDPCPYCSGEQLLSIGPLEDAR